MSYLLVRSDISVKADQLPGDVIHECQDAFSSVAGGLEEFIRANQVRSRPVIG